MYETHPSGDYDEELEFLFRAAFGQGQQVPQHMPYMM
jgi:hypothetical protein